MADRAVIKTQPLSREEIATFGKNHRVIKFIEDLGSDVSVALPDATQAAAEAAEAAQASADQAQDSADAAQSTADEALALANELAIEALSGQLSELRAIVATQAAAIRDLQQGYQL